MTKGKRRMLLALTIVLLVAMPIAAVTPTTQEGMTGKLVTPSAANSADNPYQISTQEDLAGFANIVNGATGYTKNQSACAKVTSDMDLGNVAWSGYMIGSSSNPYQGTFDGNGYAIKNLSISSGNGCVGLFGTIKNATIKNVGIQGVTIQSTLSSARPSVGVIVGLCAGGSISRCYVVDCSIPYTSYGGYVGGICGHIIFMDSTAQNVLVEYCLFDGTIEATGDSWDGGIIGYIDCVPSYSNKSVAVNGNVHLGSLDGGYFRGGGVIGGLYVSGGCAPTITMKDNSVLGTIQTNMSNSKVGAGIGEYGIQGSPTETYQNNCYISGCALNGSADQKAVHGGEKDGFVPIAKDTVIVPDTGATIRLTEPCGIGFYTYVGKETADKIEALFTGGGFKIHPSVYGTLMAHTADLKTNYLNEDSLFTIEKLKGNTAMTDKYKDVEKNAWPSDPTTFTSADFSSLASGTTYYRYRSSVVDIKGGNYFMDFSARGHIGRCYAPYSNTDQVRKIYDVARAAYNDRSAESAAGYTHSVDGGTNDEGASYAASYSPYTSTELGILKSYLDSVLYLDGPTNGHTLKSKKPDSGTNYYTSPYAIVSQNGPEIAFDKEMGSIKTVVTSTDDVRTFSVVNNTLTYNFD